MHAKFNKELRSQKYLQILIKYEVDNYNTAKF
jgi:hypothetical protein